MCRYLPEGSVIRCPRCASPNMVMLGMTYIHPSRCEATFVCDDDACEGMLYAVFRDTDMVASFADGSYGMFRAEGDGNGPMLRLEGEGNHLGFTKGADGALTVHGDPSAIPEDVLRTASDEAARWFARRVGYATAGEV